MTFKEAIHAAGAHHQGRPGITMWEALRAATDHVPTEVAAEDSASHFQRIFTGVSHSTCGGATKHGNLITPSKGVQGDVLW